MQGGDMKQLRIMLFTCLLLAIIWRSEGLAGDSAMIAPITAQDRCSVCGMFVAKYPEWVAQVRMSDGRVAMFDGPKDMLAYYFAPEEYGSFDTKVADIAVKDYYTQQWINGREAVYVIGSDVYGPMGDEFVPFDRRQAAENFLQDHHGTSILTLDKITPDIVQNMRKGHKMKTGMKK